MRYLQASPEFAMKRLLISGLGSIYQITRSFRAGEIGAKHNPEFTIVEWYRTGGTLAHLLAEVSDLGICLGNWPPSTVVTYSAAFVRELGFDPLLLTDEELRGMFQRHCPGVIVPANRDDQLNVLLALHVEPNLGKTNPEFLTEYPRSQAALATINIVNPLTANRFEWYFRGIELANGYEELTDQGQLIERMRQANGARQTAGKPAIPEDSFYLRELGHPMPPSCGVAVGWDRLVAMVLGFDTLERVMPFRWENC
jgi:elongation factor P--(R)-beta-lysine ligase